MIVWQIRVLEEVANVAAAVSADARQDAGARRTASAVALAVRGGRRGTAIWLIDTGSYEINVFYTQEWDGCLRLPAAIS